MCYLVGPIESKVAPQGNRAFWRAKMNISVLGAGAMGMLFGGYLSEHNDVWLIDIDQNRIDYIKIDGIYGASGMPFLNAQEFLDFEAKFTGERKVWSGPAPR